MRRANLNVRFQLAPSLSPGGAAAPTGPVLATPDIIAPTISGLVVGSDGSVTFYSDEGGTVYWLVDSTSSYTDADDLIAAIGAGDASGSFAAGSGETSDGLDFTGLANDAYRFHVGMLDAAGNPSNVLSDDLEIAIDVPAVVSGYTGSPTITTDIDIDGTLYDIYKWTAAGAATITFSGAGSIEYLVTSGGGAGGYFGYQASGGGGGSKPKLDTVVVVADAYNITVGAGGAVGSNGSMGGDGGVSDIKYSGSTIITGGAPAGGGGGSGSGTSTAGANGSCGGGGLGRGGGVIVNGVGGTGSEGYNGGSGYGTSSASSAAGGGGGGASEAGGNASNQHGGDGGEGDANAFTGTSVVYGSGGGGSSRFETAGVGGTNGGNGNLGSSLSAAGAGVNGTGSGGGASSPEGSPGSYPAGAGGTGCVIIRVRA